jgi:hypothetical protein
MVRAAQLKLWAMHAKVTSLLRLGEVGEDGLEPDAETLAAVARGRVALARDSLPEGADMSTLLGAVRALEEANGSPVPEPECPTNHGNAFVSLKALLHQIELCAAACVTMAATRCVQAATHAYRLQPHA